MAVDREHTNGLLEIGDCRGRSAGAFPKWQPDAANAAHPPRRPAPLRLMAESARKVYFLRVDEVDYIESYGNYVLIHVGDQRYLRRDTLKRLAAQLRDAEFEWIRRSTLINLGRVAFAERLGRGALAFTLISGTRLVSKARVKLNVVAERGFGA